MRINLAIVEDLFVRLPSQKRIDREFLKVWLSEYAEKMQDIQLMVEYLEPMRFENEPVTEPYLEPYWMYVFDESE